MLKIGEFSKIAQVSIKTLCYYDQMGLLKPAHIDRYSGYRYYTLSQMVSLNRILALKDLDFTLDQVQELIKLDLSEDALVNMLQNKALELRQRISDEHGRLLRVENRLKNLRDGVDPNLSPVVLKSAPDYLVASVREIVPTVEALPEWQYQQLGGIQRYLKDLGETTSGPDILIYHQDEFREVDLDVEIGKIIPETREGVEKGPHKVPIRIYTLRGADQIATIIMQGNNSLFPESYASLTQWTQLNGFRPVGPWRELTFNQEAQVIEIQRPVRKAIEFYQRLEKKEMEPKIINKPAFTMVGLPYFGKNENQEISGLWETFNRRMEALGGITNETGEAAIGLCTTPEITPPEGGFEYVAGLPVTAVEDLPEGFVVRHVPEHTYAVFAHKGDLASLGATYAYIYENWLPQSGYQLADRIDFEYYNEDFKDFAPDSVFYIYVPIEKAD